MRNHQKYRQILLPKIETVLTERRLLQIPHKERHIPKEILQELCNINVQLPSARLRREAHPLALKVGEGRGSTVKSKENLLRWDSHEAKEGHDRKENIQLSVPNRYLQIKKEMDLNQIFVKRNQVSDWSRKSAFCQPKETQQKIRKISLGKVSTSISKTEEIKTVKQQLSGWQHIDDSAIERIIMQS